MQFLHHKPLKMFTLDGNIYSDSAIWRLKDEYINLLDAEMRAMGYVKRIDIDPDFTIGYNRQTECFEFKISIYGIFVGKKKAKWIMGIDGARVVLIPSSRLKEFLSEAV
jgi:hypothetical protein